MTRIAVVTGGNRGIGREVARQLAARGDTVILGSRDPGAGERAAAAMAALPGPVLPRQLDVTSQPDVGRLAGELAGGPAGSTCWSTTPPSTTTPGSRRARRTCAW